MRATLSAVCLVFTTLSCSGSGGGVVGDGAASGGTAPDASSLGAAGGNGDVMTIPIPGSNPISPAAQTGNPQAVVLASGQQYPAAIAVDSLNIYWFNLGATSSDYKMPTSWTGGQVMKCTKSGCEGEPTVLASDRVSASNARPMGAFFSDGANIYWNDETGGALNTAGTSQQLFVCSVDGCGNNPQSIFGGPLSAIAVNSANVYWTTGTPVVDFCPVSNFGVPMGFASPQDPNALSGALAADEDNVYWSIGDGEILQCAAGGCNGVPTVIESNSPAVLPQIVLDSDNLYYWEIVDSSNGSAQILVCAKAGCGDQPTVLTSGLYYPTGIATDGSNVYWTEGYPEVSGQQQTGLGDVRKCAVGGCNNLPTTLAYGLHYPQGIVVDDQNVYWAEAMSDPNAGGRIWKAPK